MTFPLTLKIAFVLWLFHWQGMYLLRDIESHPYPSAKARQRRDAIRGLFVIIRVVIILLATVTIVQL